MGVNDLYHPTSYINYINEKASTWKNNGASIYFVSVNPTDGSRSNLNSDIQTFNNKLKKGLSQNVTYIDTNSYLTSSGFTTADGLHYNKNTYIKIYNYIKKKL